MTLMIKKNTKKAAALSKTRTLNLLHTSGQISLTPPSLDLCSQTLPEWQSLRLGFCHKYSLILRNCEGLSGFWTDSVYISYIFWKVRHAGNSLLLKSGILLAKESTISPNQSSASMNRLDSNVVPFRACTRLLSRFTVHSFFHLWNL